MINTNYEYRLIKHILNLDYDKNYDYEKQTNITLNRIMNNFVKNHIDYFENSIFIIDYTDDIYGFLTYSILKNIQGVYPFNLKIIGKVKRTKKLFYNKKDIIRVKRKFNKNVIFINCFNPLYYVDFPAKKFNNLSNSISLIESFTPEQLYFLCEFFALNKEKYRKILSPILSKITPNLINFYQEKGNIKDYKEQSFNLPKIKLWKLKGTDEDFPIYDEILKTENDFINIYECPKDNEKIQFIKINLNYFINARNAALDRYNLVTNEYSEEIYKKLTKEREEYYAKNFYS